MFLQYPTVVFNTQAQRREGYFIYIKLCCGYYYVNSDKFLTFALCASCADSAQQTPCTHTTNERAWWAVYTSFELNLAFSHGYEPLQIYEVH